MISRAIIEKWKKMLRHEDVLHTTQGIGQFYSINEIKGYYNDLRGKVERTTNLDDNGIPFNIVAYGEKKRKVYFPITIFQYGLGAYDKYLETNNLKYKKMTIQMADWAVNNQQSDGSWNTFENQGLKNPYSSMAQGEGASLLVRAYLESNDEKYLNGAQKAVDFMLMPIEEGGTVGIIENGIVLYEFPGKAAVLNGWIFSSFGLFDLWKATEDSRYKAAWNESIQGIKCNLYRFDTGHWSLYDLSGKYTSPFYHSLHIAQLKVLDKLDPDDSWKKYIKKWETDQKSKFWSKYAFLIKAKQKIFEKKTSEWTLVG